MRKEKTCSLCSKPARKRGWCAMHYSRWQRHGDPNVVKRPRASEQAQNEIYQVIKAYIENHGFPPTHADIRNGVPARYRGNVTGNLDALEKRGWISRVPNSPRTIVIVK